MSDTPVNAEPIDVSERAKFLRVGAKIAARVIEESSSHTPLPEQIFHYTSPLSATRIIDTSSIWASNATFLNDSTEIRYAFSCLYEVMTTKLDYNAMESDGSGVKRELNQIIMDVIEKLDGFIEVYVACFCTQGNLLSQWRGYGGDSYVSIGFNAPALSAMFAPSFQLVPIDYDRESQLLKVDHFLDEWISHLSVLPTPFSDEAHGDLQIGFAQSFAHLAATMKDPTFSEEQEWRLKYVRFRVPGGTVAEADPFPVGLRSSGNFLVPYVEIRRLEANLDVKPLPVEILRIGPSRDARLAFIGIHHFLEQKGLTSSVTIDVSSTPLRFNA